ncbi:hypothetical protein TIFTF001_052646 [Ficus carica]|uniref:Uncharacterized protein n=1 Tax=Ficus carica TaxID=3494 RepID=A0AA88EH33_FICCA|nr:hypothetical protein TIFTF001_052646 [Ficus carica]
MLDFGDESPSDDPISVVGEVCFLRRRARVWVRWVTEGKTYSPTPEGKAGAAASGEKEKVGDFGVGE